MPHGPFRRVIAPDPNSGIRGDRVTPKLWNQYADALENTPTLDDLPTFGTARGVLDSAGDLPTGGNTTGDWFAVNGTMWLWSGTEWTNQGALTIGEQGEPAALRLKGTKATTGDLPTTGNVFNDIWIVDADSHGYGWTMDRVWVDLGEMRGPQGPGGADTDLRGRVDPGSFMALGDLLMGVDGASPPSRLARGATGDVITVNPDGTLGWKQKIEVDIRDYGVVPNDGNDHSTAFNDALTDAGDITNNNIRGVLKLPTGTINVHEVDWVTPYPPIIGEVAGHTWLSYSGAGGAGTYVLKVDGSGGHIPYSWLEGFGVLGQERYAYSTPIAEFGITSGVTGIDWGMWWRSIAVYSTLSHGINFSNAYLTNFYMQHFRAGSVGGYALHFIDGGAATENRPFHLQDFTFDNEPNPSFLAKVASSYPAYYLDADSWGQGFAKIGQSSAGNSLKFESGRIELNAQLKPDNGKRAVFYDGATTGQNAATWIFDQVIGYANSRDGAIFLRSGSSRTGFSMTPGSGMERTKTFEVDALETYNSVSYRNKANGAGAYARSNSQSTPGNIINGQTVEHREAVPTSSTFIDYRKGDIVYALNNNPITAGIGHICISPDGYGQMAGSNLVTTAVVTSGVATVSLAADPTKMYLASAGSSLTIVGAGVAGADLDVLVTAVDGTAFTWTVTPTPSTSVNPATIKYQVPVWRNIGGVCTYGTAAPVTGTWSRGEIRYNTTPSAAGYMGWICVTAGTPGTWKGFGLIEP